MGATTHDAPGRVSAVTLRVSEALAAFALQGPFGATYNSTDTRRPHGSVIDRTLDTLGPRATDTMKWEVRGPSLGGSWSRRPERSYKTART